MVNKKILLGLGLLFLAGLAALYALISQESETQLDRFLADVVATGTVADITYERVNLGLDGSLVINDLQIIALDGRRYLLHEVMLSNLDLMNPFPHSISLSVRGLSFPDGLPPGLDTGNPALDAYIRSMSAVAAIPAFIEYRHAYDPAQNHTLSSLLSLSLEETAQLRLESHIQDLSFEALAGMDFGDPQIQAEAAGMILAARIPEVVLSLEDQGMVSRYIENQTQVTGRSPAEVRNQTAEMLRLLIFFVPGSLQNLTLELITELQDFLAGGRTFSLVLRPEMEGRVDILQAQIVTAIILGDYAALAEILNPDFATY